MKEYTEALQYEKAALGMYRNNRIDNETLYHIICLSVEKFAATLAAVVRYMPEHDGLSFVFRGLKKKLDIPESFLTEARFLNGFMVYCSLDFEKPKEIVPKDLNRMMTFLKDLHAYTESKLSVLN